MNGVNKIMANVSRIYRAKLNREALVKLTKIREENRVMGIKRPYENHEYVGDIGFLFPL